jgi:hypothetical protein
MERIIRKVVDPPQQDRETYLYWLSQTVGDRLSAVWDLSAAAYAFAASFKAAPVHDDERYERPLKHFQQKRG